MAAGFGSGSFEISSTTREAVSTSGSVATALVNNPKTPVGISLGFVSRMTEKDLALLERNRNIPEAVRASARSLVIKKKMGKG